MDESNLMRKKKAELLEMLKARRLKADATSTKKDIVKLILAHERKLRSQAGKKARTQKASSKVEAAKKARPQKVSRKAVGRGRSSSDMRNTLTTSSCTGLFESRSPILPDSRRLAFSVQLSAVSGQVAGSFKPH